jgi:hypothetical protein
MGAQVIEALAPTDCIGVVQRRADQTLAVRLDRDHAFALAHHDAAERR